MNFSKDDVIFVIDCGKAKEKTYDPDRNITQLKTNWIAKSNAEQRAGSYKFHNIDFFIFLLGRAGRCRDGFCFRIYTSNDYKKMAQSQTPEMLRMAIHVIFNFVFLYGI
jgi:HrpA-like RNA helicase